MLSAAGGRGSGNGGLGKHYNSTEATPETVNAPPRLNRTFLALACVLLIVRLPSLVQPMGADQGLYAYVGDRIAAGDLPYRDAWDQKPPAIHYTYAMLRSIWPRDAVVPAADLALAALAAVMLSGLGMVLAGRNIGHAAALLYLTLSDPSFQRLSGVAVRAQCESFIAVAVTGAFLLLARARDKPRPFRFFGAGLLFGGAIAFKYNAAAYLGAAVITLWAWRGLTVRGLLQLAAGVSVLPMIYVVVFALPGALPDLYDATITYNLRYSGETYSGPLHFATYLMTFPVQHARVDALWLLGGAGCAVLLAAAVKDREHIVPVAWVAAACLVIAVNGSRGLPQYFVQAQPALALAAAWGGSLLVARNRWLNLVAAALAVVAVARVNEFPKLAQNIAHDAAYALGQMSREEHLSRYGEPERRKYSAIAMAQLADVIRDSTSPDDRILIFGFAGGAYVNAGRASASRFFWSRPVIVDFNVPKPGYGVRGLREDLERTRPAMVALQVRDWAPDVQDSADFFMATPALADWLHAGYERVDGPAGFALWRRRSAP